MAAPEVFASVFCSLYAAHEVGDHWVQTHRQAAAKGLPGWAGRAACLRHVAGLAVVKAVALAAAVAVLGVALSPSAAAVALAVDGASHYWADRRTTLLALADWLDRAGVSPGKSAYARLGTPRPGSDDRPHLGTGAFALDQSWHVAWLFVASLVAAAGS